MLVSILPGFYTDVHKQEEGSTGQSLWFSLFYLQTRQKNITNIRKFKIWAAKWMKISTLQEHDLLNSGSRAFLPIFLLPPVKKISTPKHYPCKGNDKILLYISPFKTIFKLLQGKLDTMFCIPVWIVTVPSAG